MDAGQLRLHLQLVLFDHDAELSDRVWKRLFADDEFFVRRGARSRTQHGLALDQI